MNLSLSTYNSVPSDALVVVSDIAHDVNDSLMNGVSMCFLPNMLTCSLCVWNQSSLCK